MRKITFDKIFIILFFVSLIGFIAVTIDYVEMFNYQNYIRMCIFALDMAICALMYWNELTRKEILKIQSEIDEQIRKIRCS